MNMPAIFSIETVLGCNLRCAECAIGSSLVKRKYGKMPLERFEIISNKIEPWCKMLYLHIWGEPLLNPDIISMIEMASSYTRTNISTNANTIDKNYAVRLIASGVSEIIVSIDGVSQDVYGLYRKNGDVQKAIMGLTYLSTQNRLAGNKVQIIPQFIVFEHNKHEMEAFARLCNSLDLTPSFKAPYIRPSSKLKNSGIPQYERQISCDEQIRQKKMMGCQDPVNVFTILIDGTVVPCCYDHNGEVEMGNIFKNSVKEIWFSEKYTNFRNSMKAGHIPDFCKKNCLCY